MLETLWMMFRECFNCKTLDETGVQAPAMPVACTDPYMGWDWGT